MPQATCRSRGTRCLRTQKSMLAMGVLVVLLLDNSMAFWHAKFGEVTCVMGGTSDVVCSGSYDNDDDDDGENDDGYYQYYKFRSSILGDEIGLWPSTVTKISISGVRELNSRTFINNPAPVLEELSMYYVRDFDPAMFNDVATTLRHLSWRSARWRTSMPLYFSKTFTALRHLDLYGNSLALITAERLDGFTALQWLNLGRNKITSIGLGAFDKLTTLQYLNLKDNSIRALAPEAFDKLTVLQTLYLTGNRLLCEDNLGFPANQITCSACSQYGDFSYETGYLDRIYVRGYKLGPVVYSCNHAIYLQCVESFGTCSIGSNTPWPPTTAPTLSSTSPSSSTPTASPTVSPTVSPTITPTKTPTTIDSFDNEEFREGGESDLSSATLRQQGGAQNNNGDTNGHSSSASNPHGNDKGVGKGQGKGKGRDVSVKQRETNTNQAKHAKQTTQAGIDTRARGGMVVGVVLVTLVAASAFAIVRRQRSRQLRLSDDSVIGDNVDEVSERSPLVV
eukprot:m.265676 g.265676  ORF g.265676 m.265676 type:complete len:507 (-) comp63047_c0_seq1:157-1677(-)